MARCGHPWLCLSQRHRNRTDLGNLPKDQAACPGFSPAQQLEVGMTDLEQPLKPISTLAPVYPYLDCYVQGKQNSLSCKSLNFDAVCLLCEMILVPSAPLPISLCQLAQELFKVGSGGETLQKRVLFLALVCFQWRLQEPPAASKTHQCLPEEFCGQVSPKKHSPIDSTLDSKFLASSWGLVP